MDRTRIALRQMAREDPELAARLVLQTLPAAAARIRPPLRYELTVGELGTWLVSVDDAGARVERGTNGEVDFKLSTDEAGLAQMAAGASPLRLMLGGRVRIRGKRRRALRLRAMGAADDLSMADALDNGAELDPDAVYRSLPYLIDPEWTRGHRFVVGYELTGEGGGRWFVHVNDGERVRVTTEPEGEVSGRTSITVETFRGLVSGRITPAQSMREQLADVEGEIFPTVLVGRWIERAQGRDDSEMARESRQREVQARRAGSWGGTANGSGPSEAVSAPVAGDLMSYGDLYALWERQNWRAHEIDFSVDREQWAATPTEAQENTAWSLGAFYIGEERVTADLAPFLLAAPSGEVEAFLATQLVDEARHAVFFDRFGAEVMALGADDLRGRMQELQALMLPPWFDVFDGGLRDVADRIKASPDDLDLFVEGITTYHLIIEGVLATTGQRMILKYMEDHGLYPGFQRGFGLVEQDEHRHIAFGVRFLRDAVADDPDRHGATIQRKVADLVPRAAHVFVPEYAESPREFVSYGYASQYIYGYAYRKLKRRMGVLGLDCPPPDELMPGPIASVEEARAAAMPV
ncbi:MAG: ribonucleoside-diphosphate reductase beta chain [Thermoleophilaceae bacterium]|nr:ribonucleoside-diphosphate reductase beta chain [Thermoleophilaceae bacterium]